MEGFGQEYFIRAWTSVIFIITTLSIFFLQTKISYLFSWIWKRFKWNETVPEEDFQNDIMEIKKATEQIVKDWMWMSKLIAQMKNDQKYFACELKVMYETKCKELEQGISAALGDIAKKYDQRFQEMKQTNKKMEEEIKTFLQTLVQQSSSERDEKDEDQENKSDKSPQIDCVTEKKNRFDEESCCIKKNASDGEWDTSKLIMTMKKSFKDLFENARLHLSVDREEVNRELEIILTKLAEDREDIKKTILQAFAIAAEQAQTNYRQFGQIGEDTLKYIAILYYNSNKLFNSKLDETDDMLKSTLNAVSRQTNDYDAMRKSVENMGEQFGKLFEKLDQIYQVNMDHSEVIALSLEKTSDSWLQNVFKIEKMAKQICDNTKLVQQTFQEIKNLAFIPQQRDAEKGKEKEKGEIVQNNVVDSTTIQDKQIISQKTENMVLVYSSWERMRSVSCKVEDGCHSICQLIDGLEQKLRSLNESIEKLDNFIRGLNLDTLAERAISMEYDDDEAKINDDITKTSQGDAGDGLSRVITSRQTNKSLTHKFQNATAIDDVIKLTEIILRKVCGESNCQANENLKQPKPNNAFIFADEEQKNQDSMEVHKKSQGNK